MQSIDPSTSPSVIASHPERPILILQNLSKDGPGHLGSVLQRAGFALDVRDAEAGDRFPSTLGEHAGLVVLGGEMSANDDLPQLRVAEALIREALATDTPMLGHCLGAQLLARALGGRVRPGPQPEIGWFPVTVHTTEAARHWFGGATRHTVLHWHHELADLPSEVDVLARSTACRVQAFAVGPHLATQFHLEMDTDKLAKATKREDAQHHGVLGAPFVQPVARIAELSRTHLDEQQRLAEHVYARWIANVTR